MKILIVDDSENTLSSMQRLIRSKHKSADITTSLSGIEAIKHINESSFDIVFSDLNMGQVNGDSVVKHVRTQQPNALIVMLTGHIKDSRIASVIADNDIDYLVEKGSPKERILNILKEVSLLEGRQRF
ncbi:response regulator transcription factor [Piscirickettsia litoralis]|uniref:Response regulatory domain-containing protein n=1 Tax=Piscirickettsia litoralis TaxID=1891921 RepID=A0ABX3A6X5_9GAMM|nr:response regulator [Piscirickettsia litoralis]ODN41864.1 hypothetical protein BGC07_01355 [Piscirickettsia litoralis]